MQSLSSARLLSPCRSFRLPGMQEGESNYFKGIMLVLSYLIVAASFYVHNDIEDPDDPIPMAPASAPAPMPFGG
ncbi:unnamed protein product [Closterium sp. NIES-53]